MYTFYMHTCITLFLAAMSSSRSDVVTKCVRFFIRSSVRSFVCPKKLQGKGPKKNYESWAYVQTVGRQGIFQPYFCQKKSLGTNFQGVSRKIEGNFQLVSRVSKRRSKGILEKFQKCFKGLPRKFQGCPKKDFRVLQESFKGVPRMFQKCSEKDFRVLQESL